LRHIGRTADNSNINAYVVGGFVRDVLLYIRKNEFDIDIVVEGNGIDFARDIASSLNARVSPHEKFKTAVVSLEDGLKIDVATARTEFYSSPGALPEVEMSSLKLDLYRRDFTINTLAVQLNTQKYGTLIDYFFAQKDLKDKVIRIIHNLSFVEDPTRIFRAVRFEQRFNFKIGKFTEKLIKNAIDMEFFKRLSGPRVFTELKYILMEENPLPAIERIANFNLFRQFTANLNLRTGTVK
jgi:tRNA nucleotidyltransferase (CCA-adding enzyme)